MLRSLRDKSQSFLFKIFFGIIILGFAAWGVGDITGNKLQPIFKTSNYEISYQNIIDDFNKARITPSGLIDRKLAVKNGILNNVLIRNKINTLINEESNYMDLTVARDRLKKEILNNAIFHDSKNNGVFSEKKFKSVLKNNYLTEDEYLSKLQTELLNDKMLGPIKNFKVYSNGFSKKFLEWQKQDLDLFYSFTPFIDKKEINNLTDKQKKDYYLKNTNKYKVPKVRNVSYMLFEPKIFENQINITNQQIENLYNERLEEFNIPESRDYLQIIFDKKNKADSFYEKAIKSENFLKEAKKLDFKINDIKFTDITKNDLSEDISKIVFQSNLKNIIPPFKSNFGYHVIEIVKVKQKSVKTLDKVSTQLRNDLKKTISIEKLYENIDPINDLVYSGSTLKEISKIEKFNNIKIQSFDKISSDGMTYSNLKPKKIGVEKIFLDEIWNLEINELSELIEINDDKFVLININSEIDEKKLNFKEAKELVNNDLLKKIINKKTITIANKNFKNSSSNSLNTLKGLKRYDNGNLEKFFVPSVINKIFEANTNDINNISLSKGILTYQIIKKNIPKTFDQKELNLVEKNFEDDFRTDLINIYYKKLENFHNLKSNFETLNELMN